MTNAMQIILAAIAARVAYGLYRKRNMWRWIVLYWLVLTVKNSLEFIASIV